MNRCAYVTTITCASQCIRLCMIRTFTMFFDPYDDPECPARCEELHAQCPYMRVRTALPNSTNKSSPWRRALQAQAFMYSAMRSWSLLLTSRG